MRRAIAILFIALYIFNLAGYYVVFKGLQYQMRVEIKTRLKERVPESELFLITVRKGDEAKLHWLDEHEFRYQGNMYDIVRQYSTDDAQYYVCINDKQEERLFKNLDQYVTTQCNAEGVPMKAANPFKGIIKEYVPQVFGLEPITSLVTRFGCKENSSFPCYTTDVPTPPPRLA
jgi:hypothetical protein